MSQEEKNKKKRDRSWIAVENTQPFNLIFFQDLHVWEFISGMLSCTKGGRNAAMSPRDKHFNAQETKTLMPAKLFLNYT